MGVSSRDPGFGGVRSTSIMFREHSGVLPSIALGLQSIVPQLYRTHVREVSLFRGPAGTIGIFLLWLGPSVSGKVYHNSGGSGFRYET